MLTEDIEPEGEDEELPDTASIKQRKSLNYFRFSAGNSPVTCNRMDRAASCTHVTRNISSFGEWSVKF